MSVLSQTSRPVLKEQHPMAGVGELAKLCGEAWKELGEEGQVRRYRSKLAPALTLWLMHL